MLEQGKLLENETKKSTTTKSGEAQTSEKNQQQRQQQNTKFNILLKQSKEIKHNRKKLARL